MCVPVILAAQGNGVKVSNLAVDAGTVTFNVNWDRDAMPVALWSDTVWVFVDYNDAGVMKRLSVTGATASAGTVTKIPNNDKGVWVEGNARDAGVFSATIQLLTATAEVAGACAYASNYPPVGKYISASEISFTGTPEYKIVLERSDKSTYTATVGNDESLLIPNGEAVLSFTDKAGAPGIINCKSPVAQQLVVSSPAYCAGSGVTFALATTETGAVYQLYKDNIPLGSATLTGGGSPATFSGSFEVGTYSAQTVPSSAFCAAEMTGTYEVSENPLPDTPTIAVSASTVCQGTNVVFRASGTAGSTYTWLGAAGTVSGTGNCSYTVSGATASAKSVSAYASLTSSGTTCQSGNAATVTATVKPVPTISRVDTRGAASQSVKLTAAITAIVYTATNSATISRTGGGFPAGVSNTATGSSFTISGTPSAAGTFSYSLTAAVGGCTSSAATGTLTVLSAPPGAASTYIWVIDSQFWSAPLQKAQAGCTATTDFDSTNPPTVALYRSSNLYEGSGYLYNGKCVVDYATQLCPSPWRVPTRNDFIALDKALGGNGETRTGIDVAWINAKYISLWGAAYGGVIEETVWSGYGAQAWYWSATDIGAPRANWILTIGPGGYVRPSVGYVLMGAIQVRCVH
jgi:hypothetical protein